MARLCEQPRPTRIHYVILALCWAGWLFDFYDVMLFSFLLVPIGEELSLGEDALALALGLTLFSTAVGGLLFGFLADRFGRKPALQWTIVVYSAGTLLCGLSLDFRSLLAARAVTGLGVGGEWGVGQTMIGEAFPAHSRGRYAAFMQTGAPLGFGLAAIMGSFVAPLIGWRAAFMISAVPALLVVAVRRWMPESDLWEQASVEHGTKAGVGLGEIRELFGSRLRRPMLLALILTIINMASYWLPYSWLPAYLQRERNLTVAQSGWWMLVSVAGQLVGYGSFGFVSDRLGRRPSFSLYAIIMAAGLLGITVLWDALAGSSALLLAALFVVGVGTGTWSNFGPLFTELFPTRLRTTATSGIFNLARGTQFFVPLLVASMADRYGLAGGIGLGAGCALLAALWVWTLPETRGKVLTD